MFLVGFIMVAGNIPQATVEPMSADLAHLIKADIILGHMDINTENINSKITSST